jgi:hypothetical protein
MGNIDFLYRIYIGKILRKKLLQFFYIFCGGKKLKKKNNLVKKTNQFWFLMKICFSKASKFLFFLHKFSQNNILKKTFFKNLFYALL